MCTSNRFPGEAARSLRSLLIALVGVLLTSSTVARAQCPEAWLPGEQQSGFTGTVNCMTTWDPDGAGPLPPRLVVGSNGDVPGLQSSNIAMYDGANWLPLGVGFNSTVNAVAVYNGELYAGGSFTQTGATPCRNLARWNGTTWVQVGVGNGLNTTVQTLAVFNGELYVGGNFTTYNAVAGYNRIVRWNGTTVNQLGVGTDNVVNALQVYNNELYVGGMFATAGGTPAGRIARWNGATWQPLAGGAGIVNNNINTMNIYNGLLYVGGTFTSVDGGAIPANYIATWNGTSWAALGAGPSNGTNGAVQAITQFGSDLYIAGNFSSAGGSLTSYLVRWNGSVWSGFGTSLNSTVNALCIFNNQLYLGGSMSTAGSYAVRFIARWDGVNFLPLGNSLAGTVYAVESYNGQIYAAGNFNSAGATRTGNIARFDGANWQPLGTGLNGTVRCLVSLNGILFAGGEFTTAGGSAASYVAAWNGSTWSAMPGLNSVVYSLASFGGQIYAGGAFTGTVARWTGTNWVPAATTALNSNVYALLEFNGSLYAGGIFSAAGPTPVNYIARLNGSAWQQVGGGFNSTVNALTIHNNELYAGGSFTADSTGGTNLTRVARWNGTTWSTVGTGSNSTVNALRSFAGELIATGGFTTIGGINATYIARWNGAQWRSLAEGLSASGVGGLQGFALSDLNGVLHVGGSFLRSGATASSPYVARWSPGGGTLVFTNQPESATVCSTGTAAFFIETSGTPVVEYLWRKNGIPLYNGRGISGVNTNNLTISYVEPGDAGVYDCIAFNACGPLASLPAALTVDTGCSPPCDPDFNQDGNADQGDVDALINVIAGGNCP